MTLHVSHETRCSTQANGRRDYHRDAHGLCSTCHERPRRSGQRTCSLCHAENMKTWRAAQKAKRAEIAAGVAAMAAIISFLKNKIDEGNNGTTQQAPITRQSCDA